MTNRRLWIAVGLVAVLGAPQPSRACRCAPRPLAAYFAAADVVFLGRARGFEADTASSGTRVGTFEVQGQAYRGAPTPQWRFTTPLSSAECGVPIENGGLYLVFATQATTPGESAHFDSCGGSRSFDPRGEGVQGFIDVSADQVLPTLSQLRRAARRATASTTTAQLPLPGDPRAELIGLLDLPTVLNLDEPGSSSPPPRRPQPPIPVYADPVRSTTPIAHIALAHDVLTREYSYERKGAAVRERRPGWYRVTLSSRRSGWIEAAAAGTFHAVADLLVDRLAYLTENWDGYVWPEPGAGHPIEYEPWRKATRKEAAIKVVATQDIGGSLFVQVEILSQDPCTGGEPTTVLAGWVPAYTAAGKLIVWFHSRGC